MIYLKIKNIVLFFYYWNFCFPVKTDSHPDINEKLLRILDEK